MSSQPTQPLTEGPCQPVHVHAYGLDRETWEKLFDRVADAAHALDESVSCSGDNVCALCAEEPTREDLAAEVDRLRAENTAQADLLAAGEASDGYHTHNELYDYRMLYNAHAAMGWLADGFHVVKSWYHSDGEPCFGGGWFVVIAELSTGQVTNHYEAKHWDLFTLPVELPPAYDGHTPAEAADRLRRALGLDQDGSDAE